MNEADALVAFLGLRADEWSALGVWVTLAVYIALAGFAWSQLREARALRLQQHRPYVIADFQGRSSLIFLCFRNIGHTQALRVQIRFDERLVSATSEDDLDRQDSPGVTSGVPSMAPQGQIRFFFDSFPARRDKGLGLSISGNLRYDDILGNRYDEPFLIDLAVYGQALQSDKDINDLVGEVKGLREEFRKLTDGNRGLLVSTSDHRREAIASERPVHLRRAREARESGGWRGAVTYYVSVWRRRGGWYIK